MRILKWLIPLVVGGIALGPALRLPSRLRAMAPQRTVPTLQVEPMTFVAGVTAEHPLQGREDTPVVVPPIWGTQLAYICEDGIHVQLGDLIARLDTKKLVQAVDDARVAYSNAQARIAQQARQALSDVESARNELERLRREMEVLQKSNATDLDAAEKELQQKQMRLESAQIDAARQRRLSAPGVELVSRQDVEQAERALRSATFDVTTAAKALEMKKETQAADVRQKERDIANAEFKVTTAEGAMAPTGQRARYSIESTKDRLERAQRDLDRATITAPAAGTVVLAQTYDYTANTLRPLKVGDELWGRQVLATISNLARLEVNLAVSELEIAPVKVGQEALLTFDAVPGKTYHGTVERVSAAGHRVDTWDEPDLQSNLRYFSVTVNVTDPDSQLRPALKCKAQIVLKRLPNALVVPVTAIARNARGAAVFVRRNGRFLRQPVKTGDRNEEGVVITSGLRRGDVVALEDPTAAEE